MKIEKKTFVQTKIKKAVASFSSKNKNNFSSKFESKFLTQFSNQFRMNYRANFKRIFDPIFTQFLGQFGAYIVTELFFEFECQIDHFLWWTGEPVGFENSIFDFNSGTNSK